MIVQMVLLSNCDEKQGYYNDGEESIIALICDITWTGGKKEYEDGSSWESIWNFDKDGTYTRANVEIDKDGNKKEGEIRGRWSFATPNFSTLYFGGSQWKYLQPIITQYFIDNKSEIWLLFLIAHSKR